MSPTTDQPTLLRATLLGSALCLLLLMGCPRPGGSADGGEPAEADAGFTEDAGTSADGGVSTAVAGTELMSRLAGLWRGPASMTPLGDFPVMSVDFRPVTDGALFGRVDLDGSNALRFLVLVETIDGTDVLVYRNGGYFQGMLRDMRTRLVEHDEGSARYRLCHVTQGCSYIDAVYDFDGDATLTFDVKVKGAQHVLWKASRVETRQVSAPFPKDLSPQGDGTGPFPPMPSARVTVSWSTPLQAETDVAVIFTTTACGTTGACESSRSSLQRAPAGATSAELLFDQVHPGSYKVNAVLDANGNFRTLLRPDSGDRVSVPDQDFLIEPTGESTKSLSLVFTVP